MKTEIELSSLITLKNEVDFLLPHIEGVRRRVENSFMEKDIQYIYEVVKKLEGLLNEDN